MHDTRAIAICGLLMVAACEQATTPPGAGPATPYVGYDAHDLAFGDADNPEAIALVPGTPDVLVVSSKSREIVLLTVDVDHFVELRSHGLFADDPSESELTSVAVAPAGEWAVLSRTIVEYDGSGAITACRGQAVFVAIADDDRFGSVLALVDVGPMPDSVAVSPDGRFVAVANERDVVWGKCEGVETIEPPSISLLTTADGPERAHERARIEMVANTDREPETVTFLPDGSAFVATLQDSHEVVVIPVEDALAHAGEWTDADVPIVALPQSSIGLDAWPDGATAFRDGAGRPLVAVAGEANDTITVLDPAARSVVAQIEVDASIVPSDFPRDGSWGPLFRPDSVTSFSWGERSYLAVSLKASGAVGIWDVTVPEDAVATSIVKVGRAEGAGADAESTVLPEGIAASSEHGFVVVANEGDASVSLVLPL